MRRSGSDTEAPARYEAIRARTRASAPAMANERTMLRWARVTMARGSPAPTRTENPSARMTRSSSRTSPMSGASWVVIRAGARSSAWPSAFSACCSAIVSPLSGTGLPSSAAGLLVDPWPGIWANSSDEVAPNGCARR